MAQALRVGIVGSGYIAGIHSAGYRSVPGTFAGAGQIELAAAVDADRGRADALATAWGWHEVRRDWREITRADDIDLVDVCVPNHLHAEVAIDALRHGKHVVCEKPLGPDVSSARDMFSAAQASDRLAQVCFYYRMWPAIRWARQLIADGRIGRVVHVRGWVLQDYACDATKEMGWRVDRAQAGAGALGDLGSHIFDVVRYLAGEIVRVNALTRSTVARGAHDSDDIAAMLVDFESGASGVLEASWALRGHKANLGFDVVGLDGAIRFGWERANEIEVLAEGSHSGGFERVLLGPEQPAVGNIVAVAGQGLGYRDAFTIGLGALAEAIDSSAPTVEPGFVDGLRACELVEAALKSASSREWVDVDRATLAVAS